MQAYHECQINQSSYKLNFLTSINNYKERIGPPGAAFLFLFFKYMWFSVKLQKIPLTANIEITINEGLKIRYDKSNFEKFKKNLGLNHFGPNYSWNRNYKNEVNPNILGLFNGFLHRTIFHKDAPLCSLHFFGMFSC